MRRTIGLVLILAGAALFFRGYVLRQSVRGAAQKLGADVRAAWNGQPPLTPAAYCMIGGGLLMAGGAVATLKK
ncbi:MAG TPA: DUF3185 family protein [Opitutaceae bacterium]|nr:DUF3185 family protein [Opitutaceae bacterium]